MQLVSLLVSACYLVDISDLVDKRVYWMGYYTGDLKSAFYNGSDVKTLVRTNVHSNNQEIGIGEDYVFYTSNNTIIKVHKSVRQIPAVIHTEITKILFYKREGKNILIITCINNILRYIITTHRPRHYKATFTFQIF